VLEYEHALLAQAEGRYHWLAAEFWFVIAVEPHAVKVIPVVVEQHAVEA